MCTQRTVFTALVVTALLCGVVSLPADEVVPETYAFSTSLVADAPPTLNVTTTPDITQAEAEQTPPPSPVEAADDAAAVIQAKQELPSRVRVVEAADDGAAVIQAKQELPSRVRVFLKQAHNQMRRACGKDHTSMREVHVAGWSKQVVGDGEEFTIKYNPVFKLTSSEQPRQFQITLQKIFDATKITERVGTPKTTADKFHILAMSPEVCDMKSIFTTQKSEDKLDLPTQEMLLTQQQFTGHIDPPESEITYDTTLLSEQQKASIPDSINWADKLKGARVATAYNQGTCGSCYAWAATTAYGYRLAKESNMRYNVWPSPQSAMSCSNGCDGGSAFGVYNAMETRGGMPPWWCNKYNFQAPSTTQCQASCGSSHRYSIVPGSTKQIKAKSAGGIAQAEQKIMHEIATNGPAYGSLHASDGLMKHKGWGITSASDSVGAKATHAVTVVGFGIDNGHKYWIIQNSWGSNWGEEGFGRITRGNDALGIESGGITFTTPKVPTHCASAPICKNGASYNKQCHCHCLSGWSGTTCNTCDRDCSTGNLAGKSKIVNGKCQCACKKGYYSLGKTECGTKITLGGSTKKNYTPPGNFVSITLENPDNAVREGDFYVAVPAREKAYSTDGWNSRAVRSYVCGKPGGADYCGDRGVLSSGYTRDFSGFKSLSLPPGHYDVYLYKYLGRNEFGLDKGHALAAKLTERIFIDSCFDEEAASCKKTYLKWGCSQALTTGRTVAQMCAKSCKTCTASEAPAYDESDNETDEGAAPSGPGPGPAPAAPAPAAPAPAAPAPAAPAPAAPAPAAPATTSGPPEYDYEKALKAEQDMAVKLEHLAKNGVFSQPTECSGWSPIEGPWKGKGATCAEQGMSVPWCYVSLTDKNKPNAGKSDVYDDKYYMPCKEHDYEKAAKIMASKLEFALKDDLFDHPDECSGWSPTEGPWKGKGATCAANGMSVPWCYVDFQYEYRDDIPWMDNFVIKSEVYDDKYLLPCKDNPAESYTRAAKAMARSLADVTRHGYSAPHTACSGWSPTVGLWKGRGATCAGNGMTVPWCWVSAADKDMKFASSMGYIFHTKYYAPCHRSAVEAQCLYRPQPAFKCASYCSKWAAGKGPAGFGMEMCAYETCKGCHTGHICCTGCHDKYLYSCPSKVQEYGCAKVVTMEENGVSEEGTLSTLCRKSCNTCPV